MNLDELLGLCIWIDENVSARRIAKRYAALHSVLNANAQPNSAKQPFEEQRKDLELALAQVPLAQLSLDQLRFLDRLQIRSAVGPAGVDALNATLVRSPLDLATTATRLQEILQRLNEGVAKASAIKSSLAGLVESSSQDPDRVIIRVGFAGRAAMRSVVEFKKFGNDWHDIGRGFALAHDAAPEDVHVVSAKKGSIIVDLAATYLIAKAISAVLLQALQVAERVQDIRLKGQQIRALKLSNDKVAADLEAEAEKEKEQAVGRITASVIEGLPAKSGKTGEKRTALETAIKKLLAFVEQGGEVDLLIPKAATENGATEAIGENRQQELRELQAQIEKIREAENRLMLTAGNFEVE